ncbi:MAG TPA: phage terminase large subunit, partial [Coriobacteriia bacterium]|nr:phage terminase large subunit [Coriobacteriia bacterium]
MKAARKYSEEITLVEFFHIWASERGWTVPEMHYTMCQWLESRGNAAVLMAFRGAAKSTMVAVYNAWRYYQDPTYRILHQGDSDTTAYKTARETRSILEGHPLTRGLYRQKIRGAITFWWVPGSPDRRNPSMQAAGIMSSITSSRADEVQNDDVEVPKNILSQDAREKLRYRLSEQTHVLVPGGRMLWVGTPHTADSIYEDRIEAGCDLLRIPLFEKERRVERAGEPVDLGFEPELALAGVGSGTRVLSDWEDYSIRGTVVTSRIKDPIDFYAQCSWPERFTRTEIIRRRRGCRTRGEWESQYQLHARPLSDVRLDPDRLIAYDCEPELGIINGTTALRLGGAQMVGVASYWDCALGRAGTDASAFCIVYTDAGGRLYWHRAIGLTGDLDDQCRSVRALVAQFHLPHVIVETNGVGGFVPPVLRRHLSGITCGVTETVSTAS